MADTTASHPEKNKRSRLNIWIIIVAIILIYLIVRFCTYFFGNDSSLYEVMNGSAEGRFNSQYTALALRTEEVVTSVDTGYINFFVGDAIPVHVDEQTYVIDESGELSARLEEASRNQTVLNENDLRQIKSTIYDFDTSYSPDNYYDTYYFKYKMQSQILDLINSNVFDSLNNGMSSAAAGSYSIARSEVSGIMQHSIDGFEGYSLDDVEAAMFRRANYNKQIIKSNDLVDKDEPIYKVVTSETWNLVIQLNDEDDYEDLSYVTIAFLNDGVQAEAAFDTFTKAGSKYGVITLNKYMIRYISDRYVQIQILSDSVSGLKIPKSAVADKPFYIIPTEFMTQGGDSSANGFLKQVDGANGSMSVQFVPTDIYKTTDEYCYVDMSAFDQGDVLVHPETNVQYKVTARENLQGAYLDSAGNNIFRVVDIIGEDNGYYIVSTNTPFGLRVYDQILKKAPDDQ